MQAAAKKEAAMRNTATLSLEAKRELCWTDGVTLDGEPAMIMGARNAFAQVATLRIDGGFVEFAWPTVAQIVAEGGTFKR